MAKTGPWFCEKYVCLEHLNETIKAIKKKIISSETEGQKYSALENFVLKKHHQISYSIIFVLFHSPNNLS